MWHFYWNYIIMKKITLWLLSWIAISIISLSGMVVFAQNSNSTVDQSNDGNDVKLEIMPKAESDLGAINQDIINGKDGESVRDAYDRKLKELQWAGKVDEQIASGVMGRDTILDYGVLLLKFLSQLWILIWWMMIVYTGYTYMLSVFEATTPKSELIGNVVKGILVIIFSYAIMRILTRAFLT